MLGSLVEKQLTTPQQYPLTLHALVAACNQSSNREPVTSFDDDETMAALESLKAAGLVRFVLPSHGRSVVRYRHVLDEALGLDPRGLALLAVLVLRGPQTVGELRGRTERMADFDSLGAVEHELERLAAAEPPLTVRLARRPGQKEERWRHLLGAESETDPEPGAADGRSAGAAERPGAGDLGAVVEALQAEVQALAAEIEEQGRALRLQRETLEALRQSLGG